MGRTKPTINADYIVGLTDGEGCFYVNLGASTAYRSGSRVQLHFHLKLQAADKGLLLKVRDTFDCGNVYFQKEKRRNHTQCYRYTVSAQRDIFSKIIPFFRKHKLQTVSKRRSFDLFCRIADMVKAKKHLMSNGIESIRVLKKQMNQRTVGLA